VKIPLNIVLLKKAAKKLVAVDSPTLRRMKNKGDWAVIRHHSLQVTLRSRSGSAIHELRSGSFPSGTRLNFMKSG